MLNIIKANNPTALRFNAANKWQGQTGSSKGFAVFENPVYGIRACFVILNNGYLNKGFNTLRKIFEKYTPTSDGNNPTKYAQRVLAGLNVAGSFRRSTQNISSIDTIIKNDPEILHDIIAQIINVECGTGVFNKYWMQSDIMRYSYLLYKFGSKDIKFEYGVNSFFVTYKNEKKSPNLQRAPIDFAAKNEQTEKKKYLVIVLIIALVAVILWRLKIIKL